MKCEKCIFKIPFLPIPWFSRPAQIGILEVSTRERMRREIAVASGFCTYFLGLNTYFSSRPCAIVDKYSLFNQFWLFFFVQDGLEWKWDPCKRCQDIIIFVQSFPLLQQILCQYHIPMYWVWRWGPYWCNRRQNTKYTEADAAWSRPSYVNSLGLAIVKRGCWP